VTHHEAEPAKRNWYDIPVEEAVDIVLPRPDIRGPVDEEGEPCPWPWKPQQLVGAAMGQHHCSYCGAMCVAGVPHLDYSGKTWERPEDHWINEDRFAQFRDAYGYARGHFSVAAEAFGKIDIVDAYRIWHCLQTGMEKPWPG
jgi:hypothetical protein